MSCDLRYRVDSSVPRTRAGLRRATHLSAMKPNPTIIGREYAHLRRPPAWVGPHVWHQPGHGLVGSAAAHAGIRY